LFKLKPDFKFKASTSFDTPRVGPDTPAKRKRKKRQSSAARRSEGDIREQIKREANKGRNDNFKNRQRRKPHEQ